MSREVQFDFCCVDCGAEGVVTEPQYICPSCESAHVENVPFVICDCGRTVYLHGFTNICPKCGAPYNHAGQRLAPVEEWDPEDRYACFGPQNSEGD